MPVTCEVLLLVSVVLLVGVVVSPPPVASPIRPSTATTITQNRHFFNNGVKTVKTKERDDLSRKFRDMDTKHPSYAVTETDITMLHNDIIDIETRIAEITAKLRNTDTIKMTKEEFLNLAKTAYDKIRAGTPLEKDILARKMLLNLSLNDERAPSFIWKEPFATVFNNTQSSLGADERT